ncbi:MULTISPECIES: pyridoxamine 5'-phosphate oxidase family protein [Oerskovia]|uniref:PPOX class F420-dependent oxidoreductase n=1 Tax=Oerskovia merdavium TaxID=2762227 RepID=A0ABR8U065_9CELL|nr:PPOX class F420-dependent oxidoreductase [Oerskovia merdavium]MBD7981431.1 PPOX class F420-dependent oxidoreductase [Oerskovia merdavium]
MIHLTPEQRVFVTERHLATLTTLREDGSPHVVPVGFTWDPESGVVRITTNDTSVKALNAERLTPDGGHPRAAVCQVEGGRWITLEGTVSLSRDPDEVAEAVRRYTKRYKEPRVNPHRVVLRIVADKVMSSSYMAF